MYRSAFLEAHVFQVIRQSLVWVFGAELQWRSGSEAPEADDIFVIE